MKLLGNPANDIVPFRFTSFGVSVEISSNFQEIIDRAAGISSVSLLGNLKRYAKKKVDHAFELHRSRGGMYTLYQNGERITYSRSAKNFFKFYDSILRVSVGEYSPDRVFMHAGVVGWKGSAILLPADSFEGKSTLVAELVRNGADYYSDDFALFDEDGLVHAFPRPLAMRADDGKFSPYLLTVEDLAGTVGATPIPVGNVLFTGYVPGKRWSPKRLSPGEGVMGMIPYTLPISYRPEFAFRVLNKIARGAIITSSSRGTAETFAKTLLNFVDKQAD
ncbi:MAG: hypothetical protein WKF34_04020 [Pyrinomonadaceae bacterium]